MGDELVTYLRVADNSVNHHLGILICFLPVVCNPIRVSKVFQLPYLINKIHNLSCYDFNRDIEVCRELLSSGLINALLCPLVGNIDSISVSVNLEAGTFKIVKDTLYF